MNKEGLILGTVDRIVDIIDTGKTELERKMILTLFVRYLNEAMDEEFPTEELEVRFCGDKII